MADVDPFQTQRAEMCPSAMAELEVAGFEVVDEIGRGGFGIVYRCHQPALDRTVAVKVLTADFDEENRERFLREQRAMGRLTGHPNIVNVLQVGTTDSGRPFIVMQYYAQGSLDARLRRQGPLPLEDSLRLGVNLAGALETAHRLGILHRDVKPANILLTDYGGEALTDFGIAHIVGGFETATGTVTGSPAFTAPEVLGGDSPSAYSDVYGLGATLFCAITGHAAFERRSGERLVAQFIRITTQTAPDLREMGIADDVCVIVERAMSAYPTDRQSSAASLGDELRESQLRHGFPVDEMALHAELRGERPGRTPVAGQRRPTPGSTGRKGNLPLELTSFIGRRRELTEARNLLKSSRLVTLTGIGGVGKTRLALRVATAPQRSFADGVWLVELGGLTDESLLVNVIADALGLRKTAKPLEETLLEFLDAREVLLVLDNCEQVVDAVTALSELLLQTCPRLKILATSREAFGIGGEAVLRVPPLSVPDPDHKKPSLQSLARYDAVTLFAERATAAVPTFGLTEDNRIVVARICHRLDGLPLPIELAAARLRAMSPDQVLRRLTDSFALLTRGSRSAPARQQTLRLCIDWSYQLCTQQEQLVWSRLSVFAGTAELDAAEQVCGEIVDPVDLLDVLSSLVDKSILIREEHGGVVRYRLLETLRDYGREKSQQCGAILELRRRHRNWYHKLALDSESEWVGSKQLEWIARLDREQPNIREALEFCVFDSPGVGLQMASSLYWFWSSQGLYSEGRHWLDRLLAGHAGLTVTDRIKALYVDSVLAELQGETDAATLLVGEGRSLIEGTTDSMANVFNALAGGLLAYYKGELTRACSLLEEALSSLRPGTTALQVETLTYNGLSHEILGDTEKAIACYEKILTITESRGESVGRSRAEWAMAVLLWRRGDVGRAQGLLNEALVRLARKVNDPVGSAVCLESLAWMEGSRDNTNRAAVLMGAAESLANEVGTSPTFLPHLLAYHEQCAEVSRNALGERAFMAAYREGGELALDAAVAYALGEPAPNVMSRTGTATNLTKREREVADLVAEGLTNKTIAARLVISQRTAQGHVEHVLSKLGFTSRTQIAAWIVEQKQKP